MPTDYAEWAKVCPENKKPSHAGAQEGQPKF